VTPPPSPAPEHDDEDAVAAAASTDVATAEYERMQFWIDANAVDPTRRRVDRKLRAIDLGIASTTLFVFSPVILLIAGGQLATSGRPILYRGARVGRGGQVFTMIKFRTLPVGAEQRLPLSPGPELTLLSEREAVRFGRLLRISQLDELPQLWNVLRGDMSIVGPRPVRPLFFEELTRDIPQYWQRLVVRPGLTGLAQLRMTRDMSWDEKLAHDLEWIADRSVSLYLRIAAATVVRIARGTLSLAGRGRSNSGR
jgi:lipopolysaccharide/colanic/teichoic acid biosynthesis glycosyltransferase